MAPYSAAKSALSLLTEGLRMELANTPIHVVEVRPGDINTPFHKGTKKTEAEVSAKEQHRLKTVWDVQTRNMATAPSADFVARAILRALTTPNPPPVLVVGGFFQATVTPLGARLLPPRLLEWALRRYYRL